MSLKGGQISLPKVSKTAHAQALLAYGSTRVQALHRAVIKVRASSGTDS